MLVQLQFWSDDLIGMTDGDQSKTFQQAMNRDEVHTVECHVEESCNATFDCHATARQTTHDAAEGGIVGK